MLKFSIYRDVCTLVHSVICDGQIASGIICICQNRSVTVLPHTCLYERSNLNAKISVKIVKFVFRSKEDDDLFRNGVSMSEYLEVKVCDKMKSSETACGDGSKCIDSAAVEGGFSEESYNELLNMLFSRFKSFQTAGREAYHPGLHAMEMFDSLLGHPHRKYKTIHVAGTNGKGSVSNMLAVALASMGLKVGLYTSPHLVDMRERIRVIDMSDRLSNAAQNIDGIAEGQSCKLIPKEDLYDFCTRWSDTFDHLHLSFFEITTALAFNWFAERGVDVAVIETGLGGRLDSTNIINPDLAVITSIGLDHCDLLGNTLPEIAYEKAGIIKPGVPVVVGESSDESVAEVFKNKVMYVNTAASSPMSFLVDRERALSLLHFADKEPLHFNDSAHECESVRIDGLVEAMDLQGPYQRENLKTVLKSLELWFGREHFTADLFDNRIAPALAHTASLAGFHGRWERLCDSPLVIADIGHNAHGLKANFARLESMVCSVVSSDQLGYQQNKQREQHREPQNHHPERKCEQNECTTLFRHLVIVYGTMADKDWQSVAAMFPKNAHLIFTRADSPRALSTDVLAEYGRNHSIDFEVCPDVAQAYRRALSFASEHDDTVIYVGGSAYVVAEVEAALSSEVK